MESIEKAIDPSILSAIENAHELSAIYGQFPSFEDAEILEIKFSRGNLLDCDRSNSWEEFDPPSIRIKLHLCDVRYSADDFRGSTAEVLFAFIGISGIEMQGFNHQNAICYLDFSRILSEKLNKELFQVSWGGAAMLHQVVLVCENIKIEGVKKL